MDTPQLDSPEEQPTKAVVSSNLPMFSYSSGIEARPEVYPLKSIEHPQDPKHHPMVGILKDIPPGTEFTLSQQQYRSPFPPPNIIKQYRQADPRFADALLSSFADEQVHRRQMQSREMDLQERQLELEAQIEIERIKLEKEEVLGIISVAKRGQNFGFASLTLAYTLAAGFFLMGFPQIAYGFLLSGTIVPTVNVFVTGKHKLLEERQKKKTKGNENLPSPQ